MEQCNEFGYYEVSSGYRKIPGDICTGGIDLAPVRYQCNIGGRLLSLRNFLMIAIFSVVVYFGWPIFSNIINLSPLEPSSMKHSAARALSWFNDKLKSMKSEEKAPYTAGFDKGPDSIGGSDDDEEDVGRDFTQSKDLNYDSDEKDETHDQTELVSLDVKPENAKRPVPKLKKPGQHQA